MTEALRKRLLDPSFTYRKAAETDIRKTFAKFRKEQRDRKSVV